jgi:hypothetical protein
LPVQAGAPLAEPFDAKRVGIGPDDNAPIIGNVGPLLLIHYPTTLAPKDNPIALPAMFIFNDDGSVRVPYATSARYDDHGRILFAFPATVWNVQQFALSEHTRLGAELVFARSP